MNGSTFVLGTSADNFEGWLVHYILEVQPIDSLFTEDDGVYVGRPWSEGLEGATFVIGVQGWYRDLSPNGNEDLFPLSPDRPVMSFTVAPLSNQRIEVTAECQGLPTSVSTPNQSARVEGYFEQVLRVIKERWPEAKDRDRAGKRERGPTATTQDRARLFREIKREHRGYSQARVAMVACRQLGVDNIAEHTVRNAYRAMRKFEGPDEWEWERIDRIRP